MNIHSAFTQYGKTPTHGRTRKSFSLRDKLAGMGINDVQGHLDFVASVLAKGVRLDVRAYNPHRPPAGISA